MANSELGGSAAQLRAAITTLRPRQWVKNLFVAAPLVFSKSLTSTDLVLQAGLAVAAFCLLSGAVYTFNDLRDRDSDRQHPHKRNRPIASGRLSASVALTMATVLAAGALATCFVVSETLMAVAGAYLINNLAYSMWLKRVAFLDVGLIAGGFLLRVVAGGTSIDVPVSPWILICTGLLACLLGFGKRAHELAQAENSQREAAEQRASLAGYRLTSLRWVMSALAVATIAAYALYSQDAHTVGFFGTRRLGLTIPFCVLGIARFLQLALWRPRQESPTDAILRDWPFLLNLLCWGVAVVAIIYGSST